MKLRHILPLAALAIPSLLSARPADPDHVIKVTNPDGSVLSVKNHGDERFNFYTLTDNETIMERNTNGFWVPSVRGGLQMKASNLAHLETLKKEVRPFTFGPLEKKGTRMAPIDTEEGRTYFPTLAKDVHSLVVLIEYSDTPFSVPEPQKQFTKMLNEEGYSDYGSCGSARDYYIASSDGKFAPTFDVVGPIKLSHTSEWYVAANTSFDGAGRTGRFGYAIEEALKKLDEEGFDFSKYDYDEDGDIDTVFFFYAGYGQADSHDPTTIWPHQADFDRYTTNYSNTLGLEPLYLDGKRMGSYACSNELNGKLPPGAEAPWLDGIGAFCHEFGHVLGLPDLYDTIGGNTSSPGYKSVMDKASYNDYSTCPVLFSAWEKWVCHWLEFDDYDDYGHEITVPALNRTNKAARLLIRMPRAGDRWYKGEYYILETRLQEGWDRTMPDPGLYIWHVDFDHRVWVNNQVNINGKSRVDMMPSKKTNPVSVLWGTTPETSYLEPSMPTALVPNSGVWPSGKFKFGIYLSDIAFNASKGQTTLRYNLDKEIPTAAPVLKAPYRLKDGPSPNAFELTWDPVEGAEGYYVTVVYETPTGTKRYLDDYNETYIGNKTYCRVWNYLDSYASQNIKAYVRAKIKYPASVTSNVLTFVPNELPVELGVDNITDDALNTIYGAEGEIIAPEGAQVFSINGVRTGTRNLAPGLYIVRFGNKAKKVVVR